MEGTLLQTPGRARARRGFGQASFTGQHFTVGAVEIKGVGRPIGERGVWASGDFVNRLRVPGRAAPQGTGGYPGGRVAGTWAGWGTFQQARGEKRQRLCGHVHHIQQAQTAVAGLGNRTRRRWVSGAAAWANRVVGDEPGANRPAGAPSALH